MFAIVQTSWHFTVSINGQACARQASDNQQLRVMLPARPSFLDQDDTLPSLSSLVKVVRDYERVGVLMQLVSPFLGIWPEQGWEYARK